MIRYKGHSQAEAKTSLTDSARITSSTRSAAPALLLLACLGYPSELRSCCFRATSPSSRRNGWRFLDDARKSEMERAASGRSLNHARTDGGKEGTQGQRTPVHRCSLAASPVVSAQRDAAIIRAIAADVQRGVLRHTGYATSQQGET
jgi:hypothetical protein